MRGSAIGGRACGGIRRKSTLGTRFKIERKRATAVLKEYIEEEEEEEEEEEDEEDEEEEGGGGDEEKRGEEDGEGKGERGEEEEDEDDCCESTSPLYRSSHLEASLTHLDKRGSCGSWKGEGGVKKKEEERRRWSAISRRESSLATCHHLHEDQSPADTAELVKVILLGAPAVGKTSIIQQFVWNEFCDSYSPTDRRNSYYPSVVINGRLYDLKISDLPPVPYFPVDSLLEWTDFRSYGLRSATAYVLVFDLSNAADTFRHIKCLREQMAGSRDMRNVPVVVVGNKHDRIHGPIGVDNPQSGGSFLWGLPASSNSLGPGLSWEVSSSHASSFLGSPQGVPAFGHMGSHYRRALLAQQQQKAIALAESRERRDIANIVQKHWRCSYVECSAKYNWRVVAVFKELMQAVDAIDGKDIPECVEDGVPSISGLREDNCRDELDKFPMQRHHGTSIVLESFPSDMQRHKCSIL